MPPITHITVSVAMADKSYGSGTESFINLRGEYPDPHTLDAALVDGLDMYFAAWKSLVASQFATGIMHGANGEPMTGEEFKGLLDRVGHRVEKVRTFLSKEAQ
jgi:hypothetical protein